MSINVSINGVVYMHETDTVLVILGVTFPTVDILATKD